MGKTRDLFKKMRYQGYILGKDGRSKGQKWYGPKRRGGKNTQKNCTKKIFMTQAHTMMVCVITHLEPDILECEVSWPEEASL